MKIEIYKCDRCGCTVNEKDILIVPNPSYGGGRYYAQEVPFAVYPRKFELCYSCASDLISVIRTYCAGYEVKIDGIKEAKE